MTPQEVHDLPGHLEPPVLCADGLFGMLICIGSQDQCGVHVHGEPDIRWIPPADLSASEGGALRQRGAQLQERYSDFVQQMLALAWSVMERTDRLPRWTHAPEDAAWTLECRPWFKVDPCLPLVHRPVPAGAAPGVDIDACHRKAAA